MFERCVRPSGYRASSVKRMIHSMGDPLRLTLAMSDLRDSLRIGPSHSTSVQEMTTTAGFRSILAKMDDAS